MTTAYYPAARNYAATRTWTARSRFTDVRQRLGSFPLSIIQLAMRIAVGSVFFKAGPLKFSSFEFAVKLFEDEYKVPVLRPIVAAPLALFNELTWPLFFFLALRTPVSALPLLVLISVIH